MFLFCIFKEQFETLKKSVSFWIVPSGNIILLLPTIPPPPTTTSKPRRPIWFCFHYCHQFLNTNKLSGWVQTLIDSKVVPLNQQHHFGPNLLPTPLSYGFVALRELQNMWKITSSKSQKSSTSESHRDPLDYHLFLQHIFSLHLYLR